MSPSFKRFLPFAIFTIVYWPVVLWIAAAGLLGDCLQPGCRTAETDLAWILLVLGAGLVPYILIAFLLWKFGARV